MRSVLQKVEWCLALLITLLAIYLHFLFSGHAGGLWRDEVGTVNLASRPALADVWSYLLYDSFPAFWVLVMRAWMSLGFGSDAGFRVLGFLVGLCILGALWFNARRLKISQPILSLLLLGLSPTIILWGDSMRAWGWGVFWIVMTFGLIWQVVELPTPLTSTAAAIAAIGSAHSTYYNWVLLFAMCVAGFAVAARRRLWRRGVLTLGIGFAALITVIPYLIGIRRLSNHYLIAQVPFDFHKFATKIALAVSGGAPAGAYIWVLLALSAVALAIYCQFRPSPSGAQIAQQDLVLYAVTTLIVGAIGYFLFLKNLKFGTQPWYYSALMAVTAVALDAIFSVLSNWDGGRKLRLAFASMILVLLVPTAWKAVPMRMTNMDLIAQSLKASADKRDLIVVNPWYCGINFDHYYSGNTLWTTLPALEDHSFHCYDALAKIMMNPDQAEAIQDVLDRMALTLKSGNRVWLVGGLTYPPPGQKPVLLPGAPNGPAGWWSTPYQELWSMEAGYFVQSHIRQSKDFIVAPADGLVNPAEFMPLTQIQGWRDN